MNIPVGFLDKGFATVGAITHPLLSGFSTLGAKDGRFWYTSSWCLHRCGSLLLLFARLCLLNGFHELVDVRFEVDRVARMNCLIINKSLGVDDLTRNQGGRSNGP